MNKFDEYINKHFLFLEDDAEPVPDQEEDPEKILQDKITQRMDELGAGASKQLENLIKTKADILITKIQKIGIDEVLYDFVTQSYIPSLKDPDDKLFISVNLDDFVTYLSEKFSETLINGSLGKNKDKKGK